VGAGRNLLVNPLFRGNIRALSGDIVLAAGARAHTCWQAGAAGCTYTLAAGVVTITAGTLLQTVDGQSLTPGLHTLSHAGTAPMRINTQPWSTVPQAFVAALGVNAVVEFGLGTVSMPKLEPGALPTPFVVPSRALEALELGYWTTNGDL
jgi:hypothetical protein